MKHNLCCTDGASVFPVTISPTAAISLPPTSLSLSLIRCICPYGTSGARCKVLARHFEGGGGRHEGATGSVAEGAWAWVPPIPPCAEVHLSLEVLSKAGEAVVLYSGPEKQDAELGPGKDHHDLLLLELRQGRPVVLLDLGGGPVTLTLNSSSSLAENAWHRIDLIWKDEVRRVSRHTGFS